MSTYTVTSIDDGVANISGEAGTGTVAAATLTAHAYIIDDTANTSAGSATKVGSRWEVTQPVVSFEPKVPYTAPTSVTVSYSASQLRIAPVPPLRRHTDADGGRVFADASFLLNYWEWDATYQTPTSIEVGPSDRTFVDSDGRPWKVSELGPPALRAARFIDWRDHTPPLAADPIGQLNTANSVRLAPDATYFGRGPALRGSRPGEDRTMFYCRAPEGWFEEYSADDLGLIDPPERVDQPFGHDGVEVGFDEELYDPETGLAGGSSGAVGVRQQLRIKVPNVFTQMTLGTAYANADGQGFAHMGFGVETGGHIFMSAGAPGQMGNEPNNRMKLQSHGDMTIYSATGGLNMGALGGMMLGTGGSFTLGADGGVLIAGGTVGACRGADDGFDQLTAGRNIPEIPKWINSANTVTTVIGAALAGYDAYVGVSGVVRPMKRKSALGLTDSPSPTVKTALAATGVGLIGAFASFSGALSGSLSAFFDVKTPTVLANAIAGTTIWGEKGWIAGTLLTMGLYSGAGTTISSYKGVSIMGEAVAIDAKTDVEITGKSGKIAFDEGIELITGNTLRLGARKGGVGISGATIGIGDIVASGKQSETKELALTAKVIEIGGWDGVTVSGGKSATVEAGDGVFVVSKLASVWGKDTACLGGKEVYVDGTSSVRVASGPSAIHIDSSGVLLTHKASGKSDEYKKAAEHLGKLEGELKKINDQYKDLKARSIRDNGRVTGLGPIKTHLGGVEAARDDVRNQMKKITKIVDKSAALHVKKGGVFFKFGSHEFKITKQGFENASMKAAK